MAEVQRFSRELCNECDEVVGGKYLAQNANLSIHFLLFLEREDIIPFYSSIHVDLFFQYHYAVSTVIELLKHSV
jgi:hypothetical protein